MLKRTLLGFMVVGLAVVVSLSFVNNDKANDIKTFTMEEVTVIPQNSNTCCPPGWEKRCNTGGVTNNASKDVNGDGCLCRKSIPGNNANGNNQGPVEARNWKDNNQPCN